MNASIAQRVSLILVSDSVAMTNEPFVVMERKASSMASQISGNELFVDKASYLLSTE